MLSLEDAFARVGAVLGGRVLSTERVDLDQAPGRVLGEDIAMDADVPPFRRSGMDGYAVRADEAFEGASLARAGRTAAGDPPGGEVPSGGAWWVNTGAPVPAETGRVLPVEWTQEAPDGRIVVDRLPTDAPHIVEAGAHARAGEQIVAVGARLGPGHVAALATAGRASLLAFRRPRVGVLGTGTELVDVAACPGPGQIRNSNGPMLRAAVRDAGGEAIDLGVAPDDPAGLDHAIDRGLRKADVLLLSGGVSRGDLDLVPERLAAQGVEEVFHGWAVQPGGPLWFGRRDETLVFGLPGNPAASFVAFEVIVRPVMAALAGRPFQERTRVKARYLGVWGKPSGRRRFRPVQLDVDPSGRLVATASSWVGSGDPRGPARMTALAVLPEEVPAPDVGGLVDVLPLQGTLGSLS